MVDYLLDANICIYLVNNSSPRLNRRIETVENGRIFLCSIVKGELIAGALKSAQPDRNLSRFDLFFAGFRSLPFNDRAAAEYGRIRSTLEKAGTPIGSNDLLIAAIARAHNLTLITNNLREFARVPGLLVEDWTA